MRKLILETQTSIDGFIARTNGSTDWMIWDWRPNWGWDKALQQYHTDLTKSADCILLSRQMAQEGFNAHWKQVAENPDDSRYEFAKHIADTYKIVFSSTLEKTTAIPGGWENTDIAKGNYVEFITDLKSRKGKSILVYGGSSFVSSLIKARLIDEFHLIINPVVIGDGLPIFKEVMDQQDMKLNQARSFDSGMAVLNYSLK
jgi:dihydrofolate reductase